MQKKRKQFANQRYASLILHPRNGFSKCKPERTIFKQKELQRINE